MTDFDDAQQAVIDKITALTAQYKFEAFEGAVPVGYPLQYQNTAPLPYVVYDFGGKGEQDERAKGITGTVEDLKWSSVIFEVASVSSETTRQVVSIVRKAFAGFVPHSSWGELVERYNVQYIVDQPEGTEFWPPRFVRDLVFIADVDA